MTKANDIALITLDERVTFNKYVKAACLPKYSTTYPTQNLPAYASGWVEKKISLELLVKLYE